MQACILFLYLLLLLSSTNISLLIFITKHFIEKMIDFFERLDVYMKYKGLNDNKLTIETGIPNGLIGKARKRGSFSGKNISKLITTYKDLSADWLFRGEGDMLRTENAIDQAQADDKDYIIELQKKRIEALEEKVGELEKK